MLTFCSVHLCAQKRKNEKKRCLKFVHCVRFVVVVEKLFCACTINFKTYAINTTQTNGAKIIIIIIFKIKQDSQDIQMFVCWFCVVLCVRGGVNVALCYVCGCECCDMLIANSLKQLRLHVDWELSHYEHIQIRTYHCVCACVWVSECTPLQLLLSHSSHLVSLAWRVYALHLHANKASAGLPPCACVLVSVSLLLPVCVCVLLCACAF